MLSNLTFLTMKLISLGAYALLFTTILLVTSCGDDDVPPEENEEETITDITLTFTPATGAPVTATWVDADGEGAGNPVFKQIALAANTTYTLSIDLVNAIDPADPESITEEVEKEADEHMFFFGWTDGLFSSPTGNGNLGAGNRANVVNYEDQDDASLPLGLETTWTTSAATTGEFRVILKHQPDIKSATSDSTNGESDVDITWEATVK